MKFSVVCQGKELNLGKGSPEAHLLQLKLWLAKKKSNHMLNVSIVQFQRNSRKFDPFKRESGIMSNTTNGYLCARNDEIHQRRTID